MSEFRAAWWWIDRWRKSTAYTDMSASEQGVYRNLLDEIWLRDEHAIPDDPRVLERAAGDYRAWRRCGKKILKAHFFLSEKGWENETANEVIALARRNREKALRWRARRGKAPGNAGGNGTHIVTGRVTDSVPASPSPSPSGDSYRVPLTDGARPRAQGARSAPPSKERTSKAISDACRVGIHEDRAREAIDSLGLEAVERANAAGLACPVRMDGVDAWHDAVRSTA